MCWCVVFPNKDLVDISGAYLTEFCQSLSQQKSHPLLFSGSNYLGFPTHVEDLEVLYSKAKFAMGAKV